MNIIPFDSNLRVLCAHNDSLSCHIHIAMAYNKWIRNSSLSSEFSYINNNENTLNSSEPITVAILSVFGLIAIGAVLGGLFVIYRRSPSSMPNKPEDSAHFKGKHRS